MEPQSTQPNVPVDADVAGQRPAPTAEQRHDALKDNELPKPDQIEKTVDPLEKAMISLSGVEERPMGPIISHNSQQDSGQVNDPANPPRKALVLQRALQDAGLDAPLVRDPGSGDNTVLWIGRH